VARIPSTNLGHDVRVVLRSIGEASGVLNSPSFGHRADERAPVGPDRRRHIRIPLALRGRYMLEGGGEYPCITRDVSQMGVAIEGVPVGAVGERVVAYLDELGRIEGRVVRRSEDWFAIELVATPLKLERIDEKISAIVRRSAESAEAEG
jgi:hypothetical protein